MTKTKSLSMMMGAAVLAGAGGAALAQDLRIGLQEDPDVLDPHRARTYVGRIVFTSLCDKLVDIDEKLQFVPQLAQSWSFSEDNKTLTFKLRTDVQFHDGSKFDAAAARANLGRAMTLQDSMRKGELASVEKIEAPDPATLVLTLKRPDATLLAQLSDRAGMMLSPKAFEGDAAAVGRKPICSGPYKFVERVQNDRIVLQKFDQYYGAKDYHFDKLVFLPIPDTTVRLSNLRAGGLDILERMNPSDAPQVKNDASVQFMPVSGLGYQEVFFNTGNGKRAETNPFKDKRVRQALALSIDRAIINEVVGGGIFDPASQPFPPASPYHSDKFPVPKRDVERARALLKEAGLQKVKAEFAFGNNTTTSAIAERIQAMAAEAGFELSLRPTEYAAMLNEAQAGNFEMIMRGWSGRVDPDGNIYQFVTCKGALNDGRYCNAEVDKLLAEARTVPDQAKRKAIYDQAQALLQADTHDIYLYYQPWPFVLGKNVRGFKPYPDGMVRLKGVTLVK
ncbi:ABC transporter substrate-binding protein [Bordetella pertussis]|uniref:ABC-transport protein, solute-binding component n=20 Tax=Bordetella pertussis TaxID=520 RepID=Q7VVH3_BORPE|nr:ABC transporter substrate-binding protein [Bordetella pertussis]ETH40301.1 ABC transporter, substrate-binding protein, family 5 [Bordetella pertussis H918]ETH44161.1 ABC transporter, substrate-binding protein, family 5 [Bordetella pertussis H939]ETH47565.1 ABC transporter, substrate-binding protein, family 5 [Bordetella pertussis H921]ETH71167.1 ABC transporter, substrate-binding protein, family 5 [Bordetella pertussis STO1-CHLA-0011]ETH81496.1 ABC transporter, substrate-binding protein, fa